MIIRDNFEDIYLEVLERLYAKFTVQTAHVKGRGEKLFVEQIGLTFELTDPRNRLVWNAVRDANYEFAMKMWLWIINGCDDYEYVGGSNPNAKNFIDAATDEERKRATFNTAYGPRIKAQLEDVIDELDRDSGTRRATINVLYPDDKWILREDTKTEFPCVDSVTFMIRDGKLHCHVSMRSNNMFTTVVYDVFVFTMLQEYVLTRLNRGREITERIKMGSYFHHCVSAHVFFSDSERIYEALQTDAVAMTRPEVKA